MTWFRKKTGKKIVHILLITPSIIMQWSAETRGGWKISTICSFSKIVNNIYQKFLFLLKVFPAYVYTFLPPSWELLYSHYKPWNRHTTGLIFVFSEPLFQFKKQKSQGARSGLSDKNCHLKELISFTVQEAVWRALSCKRTFFLG